MQKRVRWIIALRCITIGNLVRLNKRCSSRVSIQLPVILTVGDGIHFKANTINLSSDGLAILCSTADRNQITPAGDFVKQGRPLIVSLELCLPCIDKKVQVNAVVIYSRRLSQESCQLGLRFTEVSEFSQQQIRKVVNDANNLN